MNRTRPTVLNHETPADDAVDKRRRSDRRRTPTHPWAAIWPLGKRLRLRRAEEHRRPYFTDRFSQGTFILIVALLLASMVDAGLTVYLIQHGGSEMNPVMDHLLDYGVGPFVVGKYLLTALGLPILLIFQNHYLFGLRFRVRCLIPIVVGLYAVLILYQLYLIFYCT